MPEILQLILYKTEDWLGIASNVCVLWRKLLSNKKPKIYVKYFVQSIHIAKYAIENNCPKNKLINASAACGQLEMLKYFREKGYKWNESTCRYAAQYGHLEILKYLHNNGCKWNELTGIYAARYGHLEIWKYLIENRYHWNHNNLSVKVSNWAASNNYLEILHFLHSKQRCPINKWTFAYAAKNGHLEVIKYLHTNGCKMDYYAWHFAAENGHLEVIKYLYNAQVNLDNGCKWTTFTYNGAVKNGHFKIIKYLYKKGCPISFDGWINPTIIEYLHDHNMIKSALR